MQIILSIYKLVLKHKASKQNCRTKISIFKERSFNATALLIYFVSDALYYLLKEGTRIEKIYCFLSLYIINYYLKCYVSQFFRFCYDPKR